MPTQDTSNIKEKILSTIKQRGPSLPVHIASETNLSILFASAFLSELVSEKKIKLSFMRVGNSPLYFIPGQEPLLERFSQNLKSKEQDAFSILKEKKFLLDSEQEPAIRVALRMIKDFAKPFKQNQEIIWRYFVVPESEFKMPKQQDEKKETKKKEEIKPVKKDIEIVKKNLDIFDEKPIKKVIVKKPTKKVATQKKNEKFFDKVKKFLEEKSIQILSIEGFSKNDLILKVKEDEKEKILIAYNKKRISETEIIKAYKKSQEFNCHYIVLSLAEPSKKLSNMIEAIKNLSKIQKIT